MSTMDGNPHYALASDRLETQQQAAGSFLNPDETAMQSASIGATLALAHEQRTANLIALWTDPNAEVSPMGGLNYGKIAEQIKERLGL